MKNNSLNLRQIATLVKKEIGAYAGQVKVVGEVIVIDNYYTEEASRICERLSGQKFVNISQSQTRKAA